MSITFLRLIYNYIALLAPIVLVHGKHFMAKASTGLFSGVFAFAEGDSKRILAGILVGCGMAIGAVNFLIWPFP